MAPLPATRPIRLTDIDRPLLHVVVDTEEEFDWSAPFARSNTAVSGISGLHLGHSLFRRHGIAPAYLLDYPVASDQRAIDALGPWLEEGSCLIGAQLHPWVTPPSRRWSARSTATPATSRPGWSTASCRPSPR